jgi:hypothetical protein
MRALKDDQIVLSNPPSLMSDYVAELIKRDITRLPFARIFDRNPLLIPTPNSTLMKSGTLWVPQRLANALMRKGLGRGVESCLERVIALPKSATSSAPNRPKAKQHFESMVVQKVFPEPDEILLVDDVVTRGATLLGAANRLAEAFPKARIRAFAAMRTISPPNVFASVRNPVMGTIELAANDDTFRHDRVDSSQSTLNL